MQLPTQVQCRLSHFKRQLLALATAKTFSVVFLCQLFAVSRNTFYKYRGLERGGQLDYFCCAPRHHGLAKTQAVIDAVLDARRCFPGYGKKRLAGYLNGIGVKIAANTVQRILRAHNQALPAAQRKRRQWSYFEAIAPNVIWSIDICYLYTLKQDGFDLYMITILDDHSRRVIASALFAQQTIVEVAQVLYRAVTQYGVPQVLVCDNGSQFTCSEFRRVCHAIGLTIDYAPKYYPRYKGKLERFHRTTRAEMPRATTPAMAQVLHAVWIETYNHHRVHSRVLDAQGHEQVPDFRFTWKPSAARPLPVGLDVQAIFQVSPPLRTAHTRQVDASLTIQYLKQRYVFPQLNKGDRVHVTEHKDRIEFFYQDQLLQTVIKPPRRQAAAIRKVKADGCVLFQRQRIPVECPPQTPVVIVREGNELIFSANDQVILRLRDQKTVQQGI